MKTAEKKEQLTNDQMDYEEPLMVSGLDDSLKEQLTNTNFEEVDPFL